MLCLQFSSFTHRVRAYAYYRTRLFPGGDWKTFGDPEQTLVLFYMVEDRAATIFGKLIEHLLNAGGSVEKPERRFGVVDDTHFSAG